MKNTSDEKRSFRREQILQIAESDTYLIRKFWIDARKVFVSNVGGSSILSINALIASCG